MKFFTNKISTNTNGGFSKLVEKVAAARGQNVKTASVKQAETTEPANTNDVEVRKNVHGVEGSPNDQNGEAEADGENKVVDPKGLTASDEVPVKEAQIAAPVAKPQGNMQPQKPVSSAPSVPGAKPVSSAPGVKPAAPAAKPGIPTSIGNKPIAPGVVHAKPAVAPKAAPASPAAPAQPSAARPAMKPAVPGVARPANPVGPSLAANAANTKVADAPALGKGEGDGENEEGVTKGRFPEPDREEMYKQEPQDEGTAKTEKESASTQFTRIANLTPKAKSWLKRYWSILYPSGYADSMTQDK